MGRTLPFYSPVRLPFKYTTNERARTPVACEHASYASTTSLLHLSCTSNCAKATFFHGGSHRTVLYLCPLSQAMNATHIGARQHRGNHRRRAERRGGAAAQLLTGLPRQNFCLGSFLRPRLLTPRRSLRCAALGSASSSASALAPPVRYLKGQCEGCIRVRDGVTEKGGRSSTKGRDSCRRGRRGQINMTVF